MEALGTLRFGRVELQIERRRLLLDGMLQAVGARAFDLLVALAQRRDRVVTKSELLDTVWPDLVVEENNLQVQISSLRKLLGPQAIATIPGRGYQFTAALDGVAQGKATAGSPGPLPVTTRTSVPTEPLTNLPRDLARLYGRETDLQALRSLLDANRCVTVVGAGGIGKSRLAQAAAHAMAERWSDGAWMVELASLSDPAFVPHAVAHALGITLAGKAAALDELLAALAPRSLLLVLDNCEHLLEAIATVVLAVMQRAPAVVLLLTSQEPLHLAAEQQYRLVPLAVPPETTTFGARAFGAVAYFEARVRAVDPRFVLSDESLALVIEICRRLDGLPLAIELAAARVAALGLHAVHDKLDARFKLLTGGSRATLRRHQTLRAALEWSHSLLGDAGRAVFRRLGVFAGGFTMTMAQAVASDEHLDEWAVLDELSVLVDKSLVVADAGDVPRYRLLESARAFALELLAASETADTLKRHALALRSFFESIDGPNLDGEMRTDQLRARMLPEADNLRAAHGWAIGSGGDVETAVVLASCANALEDFAVESADWLVPLQRPVEEGAVSPAVSARFWRAIASSNMGMTRRVPRAVQVAAAERAHSLYRTLGLPRREFSSLTQLSTYHMVLGDDAAARHAVAAARALMQPDWPAMLRIRLLRIDGNLAASGGNFTEALALHSEAVRVSLLTGDWLLEMMAREYLADLLWQTGSLEEAAREACSLMDELRTRPLTAMDMVGVFAMATGILGELGRIDEASASAREALPLLRGFLWHYLERYMYLFWRRGQIDTAVTLLGAADARRARTGEPLFPNDQRLITSARTALAVALEAAAYARALAAGAALDESDLLNLIGEALSMPRSKDPLSSPAGAGGLG